LLTVLRRFLALRRTSSVSLQERCKLRDLVSQGRDFFFHAVDLESNFFRTRVDVLHVELEGRQFLCIDALCCLGLRHHEAKEIDLGAGLPPPQKRHQKTHESR
jgi:hypothetical protein